MAKDNAAALRAELAREKARRAKTQTVEAPVSNEPPIPTSRSHRRLVRYRIAGLPTELVSQIDTILESWGIAAREREAMIAGGNILPSDSAEAGARKAFGEGDKLSPQPEGFIGPILNTNVEHIDTVRARYRRNLEERGMSRIDAERIVRHAGINNPAEPAEIAWARIIDSADSYGAPVPGIPQASVEPDMFRQEWTDFLVNHGVSRPRAERLIKNTRFVSGENGEQTWQRILDQAQVSRIHVGEVRSLAEAEQTPDLLAPLGVEPKLSDTPTGQALIGTGRRLSNGFESVADFFSSTPTPGGIAGPLFAMIILWFAFIPMLYAGTAAYTRLHLLFLASLGDAELNDPNPPTSKDIPLGAITSLATSVADVAISIERAGEMIGDVSKVVTNPVGAAESAASSLFGPALRGFENIAGAVSPFIQMIPGNP